MALCQGPLTMLSKGGESYFVLSNDEPPKIPRNSGGDAMLPQSHFGTPLPRLYPSASTFDFSRPAEFGRYRNPQAKAPLRNRTPADHYYRATIRSNPCYSDFLRYYSLKLFWTFRRLFYIRIFISFVLFFLFFFLFFFIQSLSHNRAVF